MKYIRWFKNISINDIGLVGGKNASLGEMVSNLLSVGVKVPNGFAITSQAYWYYLCENKLEDPLRQIIEKITDYHNVEQVQQAGFQARLLFNDGVIPDDLAAEIQECYQQLVQEYNGRTDVAVRSSATAEDLPTASFAGQQETFLNINSPESLLDAYKRCLASLFTDRAIVYRFEKGFDHFKVALSVGVQKMVRSDEASSGVAFTLDTETGHRGVVLIESSWGLGEAIVQGTVTPDSFLVCKPTLLQGKQSIIRRVLGKKQIKMVYSSSDNNKIESQMVSPHDMQRFSLNDDEVLTIARLCCSIEQHYSALAGKPVAMDVEWAKDGQDSTIYIIQARPETVHTDEKSRVLTRYVWQDDTAVKNASVLVSGASVGSSIVAGTARVVKNIKQINLVQPGDIIITDMTDPDWMPVLKQAGGVITNKGGRTCHAAIVSRELGIPAVVGTGQATSVIRDGQDITIDCSQGLIGFVYNGQLPYVIQEIPVNSFKKLKHTSLLVNIANPETALMHSFLPVDGVGLARMEFIIAHTIQIHPCALLYPEKVEDKAVLEQINQLTAQYADKAHYFVDLLSQGIAMVAAAFYPRPVIVRFSDFKTNEYRNLIGGSFFEPQEENPMLGFRGASRYYDESYKRAFGLECEAISQVRTSMGLTNVIGMVPFVRTVEEAQAVLKELKSHQLSSGENGFQIYMMCEVPSNVILMKSFADLFDGFSIGSNDLTQLVLGVDRDSLQLAPLFNEANEAVVTMITMAIDGAHAKDKKIGICGQGPSDIPEFAQMLIDQNIDSISLNPDSVIPFLLKQHD